MVVRELITKLGFDLNASSLKKYEAAINNLKHGALAVGAVVSAAGAGLFAMVHSAAETGDELFKTSQKVGLTVEQLQRLRYAAELADVGTEEFNQSLKFLNRNLAEARGGSKELTEAFKKVGVDPKGAKNNETTILRIADGLLKVKDANERVALTMKIFGRSGSQLIPFLNQGSKGIKSLGDEIERLGLITEEQAKQGEEFNDQLRRTSVRFLVLKNQIGLEFLPIFRKLIDRFLDWYEAHRQIIRSKLTEYLGLALRLFGRLYTLTVRLEQAFDFLAKKLGGTKNALIALGAVFTGLGIWLGFINPVTVAIELLAVAVFALYDDLETYLSGGESYFNWGPAIDLAKGSIDIFNQALDVTINSLEAIWEKIKLIARWNPFGITGRAIEAYAGLYSREPQTGTMRTTYPGSAGASNNNVTVHQKVDIKVDGSGDPRAIAEEIDKKISESNANTWRNTLRALEPKAVN